MSEGESGDPLTGQVLLLAAAKASVTPAQLPELVDRVQTHLKPKLEWYHREYECVYEGDELAAFLVEEGHWLELGETLGLGRRERDAVERGHVEQLRAVGRSEDRLDEFETALEIRESVVIGR